MQKEYDYLFKILLIGNQEVGKSSILLRFADGCFNESYLPTIGVDFKIKTINVKDKEVKLQIWDTAGQERYKTITSSYYKGANGVIIVFDITNRQSFVDIQNWLNEIKKYAVEGVIQVLVGNKSDLDQKREVSLEEAQHLAQQLNTAYFEISSNDAINLEQPFVRIVEELLLKQKVE
ncbi:hypothetical protein pb186bvf_001977 [Paramecium bursaria]